VSDEIQTEIATLPEAGKLAKVVEQAEAGDKAAVPALWRFMEDTTALARVSRGDLTQRVKYWMLGTLAGPNSDRKEALLVQLEQMEIELAGPDPTPLERLMVQRVLVCWLRLQLAEINSGTCGADATTEIFQRHLDRAHRQFLSAVKTLATVRRLALPVNVNLAVGVVGQSAARLASDRLPSDTS
jgi:hypothetical protein